MNEFGKLEDELTSEQIKTLFEWIDDNFVIRKTINKEIGGAYFIKHVFEKSKNGFYIRAWMFAEAMERKGFKTLRIAPENWYFNVSKRKREVQNMVAVSQDKRMIINFNNVTEVNIRNELEEVDNSYIWFSLNDKSRVLMGVYKNEERAKEVLQEIIEAYRKVRVFEMPEE